MTTLIYPSYFDRRTNKLAILLAWLTLYLYGTALASKWSDDNSSLELNLSLLGLPLFLCGGALYLNVNWFRRILVKKTKSEKFLPKWRRKKIYVDNDQSHKDALALKFKEKWKKPKLRKKGKRA